MTSVPTSADGQPLGQRGIRTRQRILEAVAGAIEQQGLRGLRLADVADEVGISPPAFYQYFNDLDEAILALCEEIGGFLPEFSFEDEGLTNGDGHAESTRSFIARYFEYWEAHRAVLWARNVAVTSGDERFQKVRAEAFTPMIAALESFIQKGQREGRIDPAISHVSLGAALTMMLDRTCMVEPELRAWGTGSPADLVDALAYVFDRALGVGTQGTPRDERAPAGELARRWRRNAPWRRTTR
ncbi:TetR/AcrR family transcriptional regulator [Mycobacterium sp. SMC-2]|uniref:TetR/AcrR family transcriptional regulator n=1 Tax=Mycobacterium sp. SMC-2 TaxID=2857058 RepID=UPI0021B1D053|nr:TetR/AcrR family transcriptional regulator [Mycobacterium sp. SMC-2]UXA06195.1 TetR/AcrR family transcriptional regulator [Mycobacterium sp. SMC-2]